MTTQTATKFQVWYRSTDHSKGPDFWQATTQVFKSQSKAEAAAEMARKIPVMIEVQVRER